MNMQDPIADMLTRIRNSLAVNKDSVTMPLSKAKLAVAKVLFDEGYIEQYGEVKDAEKPTLSIDLKYYEGKPVIEELKRVSKPSLRVYKSKNDLPRVKNGLGVAIISTPSGVVSDREARRLGLGGEVLVYVS